MVGIKPNTNTSHKHSLPLGHIIPKRFNKMMGLVYAANANYKKKILL